MKFYYTSNGIIYKPVFVLIRVIRGLFFFQTLDKSYPVKYH